jgi:hypothetical protein
MGTRNAPRAKSKVRRQELLRRKRQSAAAKGESPAAEAIFHCPAASETLQPETPAASCSAAAASTSCGPSSEEQSAIKQVAAAALVLGQNVTKTAAALGVDRRTVQRWGKFDPEFQEAMHEAKMEVAITSRQSLLALAEAAAEKVEGKLSDEQSPRVALALLRGLGILSAQTLVPPAFAAEHENEKRAQSATLAKTAAKKKFASKTATLETDPSKNDPSAASAAESAPVETEEIYQWSDLLPEQKVAMQHLYEGQPPAEVAQLASTTEETVRNWLCRDNCFFTLLSNLQFERIMRLKHRLLRLTTFAIDIIRRAIDAGNSAIAMALLRGLGMLG